MSKEDNGSEYVFIKKDGTKRYEIVFNVKDVWDFKKLHNAVAALPLKVRDKAC